MDCAGRLNKSVCDFFFYYSNSVSKKKHYFQYVPPPQIVHFLEDPPLFAHKHLRLE